MKLSDIDLQRWTRALATLPRDAEEFLPWIESHLKVFFPFSQIFLAHGELVAGEIFVTHHMSSGHEPAYLQQLSKTFELSSRTSLAWWLQHREPFFIDPVNPAAHVGTFELLEIEQFGLRNVAAHGVVNLRATAGSYFSFSNVQVPLSDWHLNALRLIAPVLNDLFLALIAAPQKSSTLIAKLTPGQVAIVRHVLAYKDDKSIARSLGISEKTVRNQLTAVYARLEVRKRGELMALLK